MVHLHAALKFAGDHAHEGQVIAMLLVHACLNLKDDAGEFIAYFADLVDSTGGSLNRLRIRFARVRGRGNGTQRIQDLVHTKVQHRRGKNERGSHALLKKLLIMQGTIGGEELGLFDRGFPHIFFLLTGGIRVEVFLWSNGGTASGADEVDILIGLAILVDVCQAAEVAGYAHRPVQRGGLQLDFVDDLINELQGLAAHAVPLIDHSDDGQAAGLADAEELEGLGLEALGGVDKHDCRIYRGEHAVGVFRKVRVAWGINQVDHVGLALVSLGRILELQR